MRLPTTAQTLARQTTPRRSRRDTLNRGQYEIHCIEQLFTLNDGIHISRLSAAPLAPEQKESTT
jgi:hypothetical protein